MYLTTVQMAEKWGISSTRITILAKSGRIPGAVQIGSRWMIPENAKKPGDGRTKTEKQKKDSDDSFFRFPVFDNRDVSNYTPALSDEELRIQKTAEMFNECRFEDAKIILGNLYETAHNRYHRISALYCACMISSALNKPTEFFDCYGKLSTELKKDFPRKKEMSVLIHEIDASLGNGSYFSSEFRLDPEYSYHESFRPHLANLCLVSLSFSGVKHLTLNDLNPYEFICSSYDGSDCYADSQSMHFYLGITYAAMKKIKETEYHYRRAFELAEEHKLYWNAAMLYYYYGKSMRPVLSEFPESFTKRLTELSEDIHSRFARFSNSVSMNSIYSLLQSRDFIYVFCAAEGYSNKEVAEMLNMSEVTVSERYGEIYRLLGVKNKAGLVEFYYKSTGNPLIKQ